MPAPSKFTRARDVNGRVRRVPKAWLEEGHVFFGQYTQTPSAKQEEERSSTPDESWTLAQLRQHAGQVGADPTGRTKADVLSAIHDRASGSTTTESQEG